VAGYAVGMSHFWAARAGVDKHGKTASKPVANSFLIKLIHYSKRPPTAPASKITGIAWQGQPPLLSPMCPEAS